MILFVNAPSILLSLPLLALTFAPAAAQTPAPAVPPNIIFVLSDDQTPAYLSCYGGRNSTPNLDRLAAEGARFTQAHSVAPLCNPTRYSILTGQFPSRNALARSQAKPGEPVVLLQNTQLDPDIPCVTEMLAAAGYMTGFVGKWHSNFDLKGLGIEPLPEEPSDLDAPGADEILRKRQEIMVRAIRKSARFEHVTHVNWGNLRGGSVLGTHNPEWMTEGAIQFIEKAAAARRPFFLHLADSVPHAPNVCDALETDPRYTPGGKLAEAPRSHPPRASLPERLKKAGLPVTAQLVGALMLDDQIGALLAALQRLGLDGNTLIVFAQDNGQIGKGSCYSGGTHSALLMRWPAGIPGGNVVNTPVSFVDFVPTFLDFAGTKPTEGARLDGVSLAPVLRQSGSLSRSAVYCEAGAARALVEDGFRYVAFRPTPSHIAEMQKPGARTALDTWGNAKGGDNHWLIPFKPAFFEPDQLYDLQKDPLERANLAQDPAHAARLARMKDELGKILATFETPFPLDIDPFVKTGRYAELIAARRAEAAKGDYWPGFPKEDWERNLNLNRKAPEEIDPNHRSAWKPGRKPVK